MKWGIFGRKRGNNSQDLTDDDRAASLKVRQIHAQNKELLAQIELKKQEIELKKQEIAQETQEQLLFELHERNFEPDEPPKDTGGDSADALVLSLLMNKAPGAPAAQGFAPPSISPAGASGELSDIEISDLIKQYLSPPLIKIGQKMTDEQLKDIARKKFPELSDNELNRAIACLRKM